MNQRINLNRLHLKHLCCEKIYLQPINWHLFLTLLLNNKHVQKWQSMKLWFLLENYKYKLISIDLLFRAMRLSTWERAEQIALNWSVMRKHQWPSWRMNKSLQGSRYAKTGLNSQLLKNKKRKTWAFLQYLKTHKMSHWCISSNNGWESRVKYLQFI